MMLMLADFGEGNAGRAPAEVRKLMTDFFVGGRSGQLGHLQPMDLLHEEAERQLHRAGSGNSRTSSLGVSATHDLTRAVRNTLFREGTGDSKDRGLESRSAVPFTDDNMRALLLLRRSGYAREQPGRKCVTIDNVDLAEGAEDLLDAGLTKRFEFSAKVRDGTWQSTSFPSRHPVTPSEWEALREKRSKAAEGEAKKATAAAAAAAKAAAKVAKAAAAKDAAGAAAARA